MNYISLPIMIDNFKINNYLASIMKTKSYMLKIPLTCEGISGSYPYSIWNGDLNSNKGKILFYNDFLSLEQNSGTSLMLNCSNLLLTNNDYNNRMMNIILQLNETGSNYIETSNFELIEYIKSKYPNYKYIFSEKGDLIHPLTPEIIDTILEKDLFTYLILPNRFKLEKNLLKEIKNKHKIIILIGNRCLNNCKYYKDCVLTEQKFQIEFSSKTAYACNNINSYNNYEELVDEIKEFNKLGYYHFKIEEPSNLESLYNFNIYLIFNLIKPEYQMQVLKELGEINKK